MHPDFYAGVAKLVDAPDLGSGAARRVGSIPITRTIVMQFASGGHDLGVDKNTMFCANFRKLK